MNPEEKKATFRSFIHWVKQMREDQKAYFRTRNHEILRKARHSEAEVDALLKKIEEDGKQQLPLGTCSPQTN